MCSSTLEYKKAIEIIWALFDWNKKCFKCSATDICCLKTTCNGFLMSAAQNILENVSILSPFLMYSSYVYILPNKRNHKFCLLNIYEWINAWGMWIFCRNVKWSERLTYFCLMLIDQLNIFQAGYLSGVNFCSRWQGVKGIWDIIPKILPFLFLLRP